MISGGDYYTKLEGVSTSSGQIDTFTSTGQTLTIDFDNAKTGKYNMLFDNFHNYGTGNNGTGTVYMDQVNVIQQPNEYVVDWNKVVQNTPDAVQYKVDTDTNGTYETTHPVKAISTGQDLTALQYTFPTQTIAWNSGQQTAISSWYTVVGNIPGYTTWGQNIPFTTGGQGNPTVQTTNGSRAASGNFQGGLNVQMNVPSRGETYTGYVYIGGAVLTFTVKRDPMPPLDVGTLDFGTKTVNYSGTVTSNWVSFPFVPEPTAFTLTGIGNPTVQLSNGSRGTTGTVSYGTNIQAQIPPVGQTRVIDFTINGKTGKFTIKRQ